MSKINKHLLSLFEVTLTLLPEKTVIPPLDYMLKHTEEETLELLGKLLKLKTESVRALLTVSKDLRVTALQAHLNGILEWSGKIDDRLLVPIWTQRVLQLASIHTSEESLGFLKHISSEQIDFLIENFMRNSLIEFIGVWGILDVLGISFDCLKYWDFDHSLDSNLKAIGYLPKTLGRLLTFKTQEAFGNAGVMADVMNMRYLSNIVDWDKGIANAIKLKGIGAPNNLFKSNRALLDQCWQHILTDLPHGEWELNSPTHSEWIMRLYLNRYQQWADDGEIVVVEGERIYVHHHTVIEEYCNNLALRAKFPLNQYNKRVPTSIKQHPKDFFAKNIQRIAKETKRLNDSEYNGIVFPALPPSLELLDKSKYIHLNTPVSLVSEGAAMHHCVGGEDYIEKAQEDYVYFHYDDGSKHGVTIELRNDRLTNSRDAVYGIYFDDGTFGFSTGSILSSWNDDPSDETMKQILNDLFYCGQFDFIEDERERRKYIHEKRVIAVTGNAILRDWSTTYYTRTDPLPLHPYKFEVWLGKELCDIRRKQLADQGGRTVRYPNTSVHGWDFVGEPGLPAGRMATLGAMAGDFDGDTLHPGYMHTADLDVSLTYPNVQEMLATKHLQSVGRAKVDWVKQSKPSVVLPHLFITENDVNYCGASILTNREKLIREYVKLAAIIDGQHIYTNHTIGPKLDLACWLNSQLTSRIVYGFMSEREIYEYTQRLAYNPSLVFDSVLNTMYFITGKLTTQRATEQFRIIDSRIDWYYKCEIPTEIHFEQPQSVDRLVHFPKRGLTKVNFDNTLYREFIGFHGSTINLIKE